MIIFYKKNSLGYNLPAWTCYKLLCRWCIKNDTVSKWSYLSNQSTNIKSKKFYKKLWLLPTNLFFITFSFFSSQSQSYPIGSLGNANLIWNHFCQNPGLDKTIISLCILQSDHHLEPRFLHRSRFLMNFA